MNMRPNGASYIAPFSLYLNFLNSQRGIQNSEGERQVRSLVFLSPQSISIGQSISTSHAIPIFLKD